MGDAGLGDWEDRRFVFVIVGEGWEKHQENFMLCRSGSVPVGLDGRVGFLLSFERLLTVIVVQRSFSVPFPAACCNVHHPFVLRCSLRS